jgi:anti-anti-sigma factor
MRMQNVIEMVGDVPVLHASGELDRTSDLDTTINAVIARDFSYVVIDFAHATYINSYGLALLVKVMKHCRGRGGDVLLANVPPVIQSSLDLVRFDRIFTIYPDIPTALAAAS